MFRFICNRFFWFLSRSAGSSASSLAFVHYVQCGMSFEVAATIAFVTIGIAVFPLKYLFFARLLLPFYSSFLYSIQLPCEIENCSGPCVLCVCSKVSSICGIRMIYFIFSYSNRLLTYHQRTCHISIDKNACLEFPGKNSFTAAARKTERTRNGK